MSFQWIANEVSTPIVELRRYRLRPGRFADFVDLFETRFIEQQEAVGARVLGSFAVEGALHSVIWLRGFKHMDGRRHALEAFYASPTWLMHRDAANASIADNDDVHLLRAIAPERGIPITGRRPAPGERRPAQRYRLIVSELRFPEALANYHLWLRLLLRNAGVDPLASLGTLAAENNYPRLPVWQNRPVHVALVAGETPLPELPLELRGMLKWAPEVLTLRPTARSLLR
jgi:hypothetical protein